MTVFSSPTALAFTPHARGSTRPSEGQQQLRSVYPACAGIDPQIGLEYFVRQGLPRMRGDRPCIIFRIFFSYMFTPHARGSTLNETAKKSDVEVYPACAGIDPCRRKAATTWDSLPRMRGDRPITRAATWIDARFTPHARGSTRLAALLGTDYDVYPACAGIDRCLPGGNYRRKSLPRMRGDRPQRGGPSDRRTRFTPHARGSTLRTGGHRQEILVYPACAGIDPTTGLPTTPYFCLPRMRGDRPQPSVSNVTVSVFTPHARGSTATMSGEGGCSMVYPACAGIDLSRLISFI